MRARKKETCKFVSKIWPASNYHHFYLNIYLKKIVQAGANVILERLYTVIRVCWMVQNRYRWLSMNADNINMIRSKIGQWAEYSRLGAIDNRLETTQLAF